VLALSFAFVSNSLLFNFPEPGLYSSKFLISFHFINNFGKGTTISKAQIFKHSMEILVYFLEIWLTLALLQLLNQAIFVLQHFVHVVAVNLFSESIVIIDFLPNLSQIFLNQLVEVRQIV
jgi:hypothetical protein